MRNLELERDTCWKKDQKGREKGNKRSMCNGGWILQAHLKETNGIKLEKLKGGVFDSRGRKQIKRARKIMRESLRFCLDTAVIVSQKIIEKTDYHRHPATKIFNR